MDVAEDRMLDTARKSRCCRACWTGREELNKTMDTAQDPAENAMCWIGGRMLHTGRMQDAAQDTTQDVGRGS